MKPEDTVGGPGPHVRGLRGENSNTVFQDLYPKFQELITLGESEKKYKERAISVFEKFLIKKQGHSIESSDREIQVDEFMSELEKEGL